MGWWASLSRPAATSPDLTWDHGFETILKALELLREALPKRRRVAVMWDGNRLRPSPCMRATSRKARRNSAVALVSIELKRVADLEPEFARLRAEKAEALVVLPSGQITIPNRNTIMTLASRDRLPTLVNIVDDRPCRARAAALRPEPVEQPAVAPPPMWTASSRARSLPTCRSSNRTSTIFIVDLAAARALGVQAAAVAHRARRPVIE
jgi:hypothetical protein